MSELEKVSWIGSGKVGRTLARALKEAGYKIGVVTSRKNERAKEAIQFIGAGEIGEDPVSAVDSGFVHFITTNDDSIAPIVREIDARGPASLEGHYFFHTSGAISSAVLDPLKDRGAQTGSIHPLQVFADPEKALQTLPGIYYAIEGTDRAMTLAVKMVDRLQGRLLLIPAGRKVLYHVAGVFAANYLTVLVELVLSIMEDIGETPEDAYQAFLPLMVGALENIEEFGVSNALTGPVARGDLKTLKSHLKALEELRPEVLRAYKTFGSTAVEIAVRGRAVSPEKGKQILELFK